MLRSPRLLLFFLAAPLMLAGCGSSPEATTAGSPATSPAITNKDAPAELLTTFHAMAQRLRAAPLALTPDQEAARQLAEYYRGAQALAIVEAQQGRDPAMQRWAAAFAQGQQPPLQQVEAVANHLTLAGSGSLVLRQRLRATAEQLVATEQATRVEADGRQRQAPNLGMIQGHEDDGTGNMDADFAAVLLLQQHAALETARAVATLAGSLPLRAAAVDAQRRAQLATDQLLAWQGQRHPRS
jgi:hypothetical protein